MPSIASIRFTCPSTWLAQVGRVGVLEVGHEALGARVERVDHELAVGRAGDLDAAVLVVGPRRARPASRPRGSRASRRGSQRAAGVRAAARSRRAASSSRGAARSGRAARRGRRGRRRRGSPRAARSRVGATSRLIGRLLRGSFGSSGPAGSSGGRSGSGGSRCAAICSAQPGLPAAIASAPVRGEVGRLARAELGRGLRLHEVVDAGRAAAQLPVGGLEQLEPGDRRAAASRGWRADALGVRQVAGVVVGDAERAAGARGACGSCAASSSWTSRTLAAERRRALGPRRVVGQQVRVVLHRRAAAGDVDRDDVERPRRRRSSRARAPAPRPRRPRAAAARRSSAAAGGAWTSQPSAASTRTRGGVDVAEEDALDAALHEARRARAASRARARPRAAARSAARACTVGRERAASRAGAARARSRAAGEPALEPGLCRAPAAAPARAAARDA